MTQNMFTQATRIRQPLRIGISGLSGGGKTQTALRTASWIASEEGGRIAFVDTERGKGQLYAMNNGEPSSPDMADYEFDFDTLNVDAPYDPAKAIAAIKNAADNGYSVVILDSVSHFWFAEGGTLSIADTLKKTTYRGDGFRAMAAAKQQNWNPLVEAIIDCPIHVIVCMREKHEYDIGKKDVGGGKTKTTIERAGTAPVVENGFIYELDLVIKMSLEHHAAVDKTRFAPMADKVFPSPGPEWVAPFYFWAQGGIKNKYVYGDGTPVKQTAQAKRIFSEYAAAHDGAVPFSRTDLMNWYRDNKSAQAEVEASEEVPAEAEAVPA